MDNRLITSILRDPTYGGMLMALRAIRGGSAFKLMEAVLVNYALSHDFADKNYGELCTIWCGVKGSVLRGNVKCGKEEVIVEIELE